jgi:hypothetical protein
VTAFSRSAPAPAGPAVPPPPPARLASAARALLFALAAATLVGAAALTMFSAFMFYDDEGYVLHSLRDYAARGGLYREVYSQYGPFPFVFHDALHALGLPLSHTVGRVITLLAWIGAALGGAALVGSVTRSLVARFVVVAALFPYLWVMASEPTHPGGLIVALVALAACLGYRWLAADRVRAWALLAGAVTAALLLTKINVGLFAAFAAGGWLLLHHRDGPVHRWAPAVMMIACAALPLALMRPLIGTDWVQSFALVWACGALAVVRAVCLGTEGRTEWSTLGWGLLGAAAAGAVVLVPALLRGTTPADLLDGIVLAPTRQPLAFSIRYLWTPGIRLVALGSLALCMWACTRRRYRDQRVETAIALGRLLAALALAANLARFPHASADYLVFGWVLPCLWLFAWPLRGTSPEHAQARAWLVLLLLGQCLHVFPVAGSQIAWGTWLALPLAALGAWEAARWLADHHAAALGRHARALARAALAATVLFAAVLAWKFIQVGARYREGAFLALPGAELIRLPERASALFRLLALNASVHADVLFSEPGMFSLNLWSDVPPPTRANVTHWFSLLSAERQQAIIEKLRASPRAAVIVQREHVNYLAGRGLGPKGPLHDFIAAEFTPVFTLDDFEFCVRRGRTVAPYHVGDVLELRADAAAPAAESRLLRLPLLPPPAPIARIDVSSTGPAPLVFDASTCRAEFQPANSRGEPTGPARPLAWPLVLPGPGTLHLYFAGERLPRPERTALLTFRDAAGAELLLARLRD